jgi:nitrite reductase/ring-hydroxylating ferredoxin subunit
MADDDNWVAFCSTSEFASQRKLMRVVDGMQVLLCRYGDHMVAIHNYCTHLGKPLDQGRIMGGRIYCPYHGASFDLDTGKAVSGPAVSSLHRFPVRVTGEHIFIDISRKPHYGIFSPAWT